MSGHELWQRGLERGDVRPDADTVTDLLIGPLVLGLMAGHPGDRED